jgi:peptidoglycan/LPS O-acetylase OafA/YrhL
VNPFGAFDRWSVLALMRFVLASIVAFNHLGEYTSLGLLAVVPRLGSFEAILGFLLISGYSVGASYLKRPEGFLLRRLKRLYPVYLASIAIALAVALLVQDQAWPGSLTLLANMLFLNQLVTRESFVGPAWSLSLEFWLYLSLPWLAGLSVRSVRRLVWASFAAYLAYTALRTLLHLPYYSGLGFGANLPLLAFVWICGLRLARGDERDTTLRDLRWIFVLHIAVATAIQLASRARHQAIDAFLAVDLPSFALQALTLWVVYRIFTRLRASAQPAPGESLMQVLGHISYPLYLIHIPVYVVLAKNGIGSAFLCYLVSVLAAWGVYLLVDLYSQRRPRSAAVTEIIQRA